MEKIVALLPIREHSERVKNKNFRDLCGKPLYQWILNTLLSCKCIERVVIDTDSEEFIKELHELYPDIQTILRPEEIRGGHVSMNRVIAYDMSVCTDSEFFLQTHTTNPLLSKKSIQSGIEKFFSEMPKYDSLFTVNRIQARTYWADGSPINHTLGELKRTQDLPAIYEENSNFFIFSRESFKRTNSRIGVHPYLFETPPMQSLEIDEPEDFEYIQLLMQALIQRGALQNESLNF